jgi:hypothetical protein
MGNADATDMCKIARSDLAAVAGMLDGEILKR